MPLILYEPSVQSIPEVGWGNQDRRMFDPIFHKNRHNPDKRDDPYSVLWRCGLPRCGENSSSPGTIRDASAPSDSFH